MSAYSLEPSSIRSVGINSPSHLYEKLEGGKATNGIDTWPKSKLIYNRPQAIGWGEG
jgi:hypothetical protein